MGRQRSNKLSNRSNTLCTSESHFIDRTFHSDGMAYEGAANIIRNTLSHYELSIYQTNKIQTSIIHVNAEPRSSAVAAIFHSPRHLLTSMKHYPTY